MSINLEKFIENDWNDLKGAIQSKWDKLTTEDVEDIQGSYENLIEKIKKLYGMTRKDIEKQLNKFILSEEFEDIRNSVNEKTKNLGKNVFSLKELVERYVKNYAQSLKERSGILEENVVSYARENPFKILGTAVLIGFVLNKMWSYKDN